jgi:hypothetical protein
MARRLDDEIAGLVDEMQGVRNEFHRLKAIEEAVAVERDSDMLLNERWLSLGPAGAPPGALPASSNCEIASSRYDPQGQGAGGEFRETGSRGARPSSTTKVHFPLGSRASIRTNLTGSRAFLVASSAKGNPHVSWP